MILRVVIKIKYSDKLICNGITSITSFVKAGQLFDTHTPRIMVSSGGCCFISSRREGKGLREIRHDWHRGGVKV